MAAGEPARMHRLQQELRRAWNVVRKTRTPARGDTSTPRKATLAARMGARSRAARECADRRQSRKGDANMLLCGGPVKTNPSIAFLGGWQSAQLWVARFCLPQQNRDASSDVATPPRPTSHLMLQLARHRPPQPQIGAVQDSVGLAPEVLGQALGASALQEVRAGEPRPVSGMGGAGNGNPAAVQPHFSRGRPRCWICYAGPS